jgi:hypothetical protein
MNIFLKGFNDLVCSIRSNKYSLGRFSSCTRSFFCVNMRHDKISQCEVKERKKNCRMNIHIHNIGTQ